MTVKTHVPIGLRVLVWLMAGIVISVASIVVYRVWATDRSLSPGEMQASIDRLESDLKKSQAELDAAITAANAADTQIKVERAYREELAKQIKEAEAELAKLRGDLAFFESVMPIDPQQGGVAIARLSFDRDGASANTWRLRALIGRGQTGAKDFVGAVQLVVQVQGTGGAKPQTLAFPTDDMPAADWQLRFSRYQRIEAVIVLADYQQPKTAELKVLEAGTVRTRRQLTF